MRQTFDPFIRHEGLIAMEQRTVHLFVFDTLADWEPSYAVAGIGDAGLQLHPACCRVQTVGLHAEPVTTVGGLHVLPDLTLDALEPLQSAMLILPGGAAWDQGHNVEAVDRARAFLAAGIPVAAICGATAALARGGLLDDRRHTSNSLDYLKATGYKGSALYVERPAVTDGNLITASGAAALEFAYEIVGYLGLYSAEVLDAWYGLFKTGHPAYYGALLRAGGGSVEHSGS
jgi:putative intracellular protease/amidase